MGLLNLSVIRVYLLYHCKDTQKYRKVNNVIYIAIDYFAAPPLVLRFGGAAK